MLFSAQVELCILVRLNSAKEMMSRSIMLCRRRCTISLVRIAELLGRYELPPVVSPLHLHNNLFTTHPTSDDPKSGVSNLTCLQLAQALSLHKSHRLVRVWGPRLLSRLYKVRFDQAVDSTAVVLASEPVTSCSLQHRCTYLRKPTAPPNVA